MIRIIRYIVEKRFRVTMETFAGPKPFVDNPKYKKNRSGALEILRNLIATGRIDPPLVHF